MKLLTKGLCVVAALLLVYQNNTYASIPDSIRVGADAVYNSYDTRIEIISPKRMIVSKRIEVTVLNEKGRSHTDFSVYYDPDCPIKSMKADLFDEKGVKIKTFKGKDIKDYSLYSESTLFHDNRMKEIEVFSPKYPYKAIFEYTQEFFEFISIPGWYPQIGYRVGVENATFTLTQNESFQSRYLLFNLNEPEFETPQPGKRSLSWKVEGLKPIDSESFASKFFESTPSILLVPECFSYKGSSGCYSSWESYGEWVSSLVKNRDNVSDNLFVKVQELVGGVESEREKIKILYKFMQNQTRYVSIQYGLGGFQPFPAKTVETTGYGDCKALVNFTKTLLKIANINSYYCEIGVDNTQIMFDNFPSAGQTNHIVLCVPVENDTIWLECTSQQYPFGYLPYSMQRQKVLLVDETNSTGRIVNTPQPEASFNLQQRSINLLIDADGNAKGNILTVVQGGELSKLFPELWKPEEERKRIINKKYSIPGFQLLDFSYSLDDGDNVSATEVVNMTVNKIASKTGDRIFIKSNAFGGISNIPAKSSKRRSELVIKHSYTHSDTITISIPEGYSVEHVPNGKELNFMYGSLSTSYDKFENSIRYIRSLTIKRFRGQPVEYNSFIDFLLEINRADNQNIVLVKGA